MKTIKELKIQYILGTTTIRMLLDGLFPILRRTDLSPGEYKNIYYLLTKLADIYIKNPWYHVHPRKLKKGDGRVAYGCIHKNFYDVCTWFILNPSTPQELCEKIDNLCKNTDLNIRYKLGINIDSRCYKSPKHSVLPKFVRRFFGEDISFYKKGAFRKENFPVFARYFPCRDSNCFYFSYNPADAFL